MEHVHIAALRPNLDALESKQIKAVVTLIWPYSSSQRQFALLLAEPDFRLRRRNGQVRARFASTSARALAATGVGIGDEVVLSLHGAQFVQDGAVSTPGKSIDWELVYTQTVAISVRRDGAEIANLELIDAAPTPAPRSPVKRPAAAPSPIPQWSSPAFLKRGRLSDGPFFEQPAYDPLSDVGIDGHDKKRRRKSYRDWKAWTYTARTPSPEKEDADLEDEVQEALSSPSRPPQLPKTPISPSRTEPMSAVAPPADDSEYIEETTIADSAEGDTTVDDGDLQKIHVPLSVSPERRQGDIVRNGDYYSLYDGHNDAPSDSQYDFGGDTELNTEDEEEDEDITVPELERVDASTTDIATELEDESEQVAERSATVASQSIVEATGPVDLDAASATEEGSDIEVIGGDGREDDREDKSVELEGTTIDETVPEVVEPIVIIEEPVPVTMPPPSLPALHTDFAMNTGLELLTPIGKEPSSPNLKAVDSATLPLPSPFPGEQGASYFENGSDEGLAPLDGPSMQDEPEAESDADYIMESSFFSSINSARAVGLHQDHETAFTPLRFTFGMDGAGWSRPLELSSPPPESIHKDNIEDKHVHISSPSRDEIDAEQPDRSAFVEPAQSGNEVKGASPDGRLEDGAKVFDLTVQATDTRATTLQSPSQPIIHEAGLAPKSSNEILLSSDIESADGEDEDELEDEDEEGDEDEVMAELEERESSEEDDTSESEDEIEVVEDLESESKETEVHIDQEIPESSQMQTEPQSTADLGPEADVEPRQEDTTIETEISAAVPEIIDLGSSSADEDSDDEAPEVQVQQGLVHATEDIDRSGLPDQAGKTSEISYDGPDQGHESNDEPLRRTSPGSLEVTSVTDNVQQRAIAASSGLVSIAHESSSAAIPDTYEQPLSVGFDDWQPQLGLDEPLHFTEDDVLADRQADAANRHEEHPDIKMESVEDGSLYLVSQPETQDVPQESGNDPATGHKVGELQAKSVPASAPARNTRSKAKSAASPPEEEGYVSRVSTSARRTRSKASIDSTNRDTTSPTLSRGHPRSTASPIREATQTSPYSLRSQSKHLSPDNVASQPAQVRRSPRRLSRRETDFDIVPSQMESRDLFGSMFEPSQELGFGYSQSSQGRFSDVGFVKDSEEGTSHSEASISTVQYSDPVEVVDDTEPAKPRLRPPPLSLSQPQRQTRSRSHSIRQQGEDVSSSLSQFTPRRSPRLTRSSFSATPSPHLVRTTRDLAQVTATDAINQGESLVATQRGDQQSTLYPMLPKENEDDVSSSLPAVPVSAQQSTEPSVQQESNLPTPGDTQQTALEPPVSFQARQPEQSLITPELTQATSADATLRSFDIALPGVQTQPAPLSPVLRTSPRRKPAITEPTPSSPIQQSSDAPSSPTTTTPQAKTTQPPLPTIGLSTPLAYYTPLRDLHFFLNRSSQFHSGSSPDILALVTTPTTAPTRVKKGPRDHTTTLSITDPSIYPSTRSVSVFRPHAAALPQADAGDVILLRAFEVHSQKRSPVLRSGSESAWCVWRFQKPVWGKKKGAYGELRAREEVRGPEVERGQGEWGEVGRVRAWFVGVVGEELGKEHGTKSQGNDVEVQDEKVGEE